MLLQEVEQPRLLRQGSGGQGGRGLGDIAVAAMTKSGYKVVDGQVERVNGLDAYIGTYRGEVKGMGKVLMRAAHISLGRQVFVVAGLAAAAEFPLVDRDLMAAVRSFRELSRDEASRIHPNRLDFYVVRQGDSWQSIAERSGGVIKPVTLAVMPSAFTVMGAGHDTIVTPAGALHWNVTTTSYLVHESAGYGAPLAVADAVTVGGADDMTV